MLVRLGLPLWVSYHCHEINISQGALFGRLRPNLQAGGRSIEPIIEKKKKKKEPIIDLPEPNQPADL